MLKVNNINNQSYHESHFKIGSILILIRDPHHILFQVLSELIAFYHP